MYMRTVFNKQNIEMFIGVPSVCHWAPLLPSVLLSNQGFSECWLAGLFFTRRDLLANTVLKIHVSTAVK